MRRRRSYWHGSGEEDLLGVRPREGDQHDRLIPMINVVFLLLTFFLIAGTIRVSDGLNIEPPAIATSGVIDEQGPTLSVEASGALHFGGRAVTMDEAVAVLKEASASMLASGADDGEIQIKADRNTPSSVILPLLQRLRNENFDALRLIAIRKAE
ncbi:MAG: ExbD/TolR family protein [Rhodomicrobiaceae bacterium]